MNRIKWEYMKTEGIADIVENFAVPSKKEQFFESVISDRSVEMIATKVPGSKNLVMLYMFKEGPVLDNGYSINPEIDGFNLKKMKHIELKTASTSYTYHFRISKTKGIKEFENFVRAIMFMYFAMLDFLPEVYIYTDIWLINEDKGKEKKNGKS